jgi:hypothetical protein
VPITTNDSPEAKGTPTVPKRPQRQHSNRDDDPQSQLALFGKYGGFGGLVLFVFLSLFTRFADLKPIFGNLSANQTYSLIVIFMVLVFIFAVFGLVCWVYVNNQKRESRAVRVGLLVLMALVAFGIAAWATIGQTKENVAKSLNNRDSDGGSNTGSPTPPSFTPPDLESHKWSVNIRSSAFPAFEGQTEFRADHTFDAMGNFLVPTQALNEHIECPGGLKGTWSYAKDDHTALGIENMEISQFSDYKISKDQYVQCAATLQAIASKATRVTTTCPFISSTTCKTRDLEIHLSSQ